MVGHHVMLEQSAWPDCEIGGFAGDELAQTRDGRLVKGELGVVKTTMLGCSGIPQANGEGLRFGWGGCRKDCPNLLERSLDGASSLF